MVPITPQRRLKIFATGFAPIAVLLIVLTVAAQFGINVLSFLTTVEPRNARDHVVRTKVLGVVLDERPATDADLMEEDAVIRVSKLGVLVASAAIIGGCVLMCFAAATGKPAAVLAWCDRKLGMPGG